MDNTPRGLATLALLKTRFDQGQDHLGLLEPFVIDAISHLDLEFFIASDIQEVIGKRSGLRLPIATINTILNRLKKRTQLVREGGRFLRTAKGINDPQLDARRNEIEQQHLMLGAVLREFASQHEYVFGSESEALLALATFISDHKVSLLLSEPLSESPVEKSSLDRRATRLVARFIREKCLGSAEFSPVLAGLIEGMVLEDALLLRDIADIARRFHGLQVFLDTPVLFAALDLTGVSNGIAAKEGLALIREAGAVTFVFDRTVSEIKRILSVYEYKLGTAEGRLSLYPTDFARHALTAKLTPGDVRTISATLERRLASIGIVVKEVPKHDRRYTLNEEALAKVISDPNDPDAEKPRVRHDVDCVAGVLTLRAGRNSSSVEDSGAIFSTTSRLLIQNVQKWYHDESERGSPPIIHQMALTSLAWLKKPAAAKGIKVHELAALCSATLRPSRETWRMFIGNLRQLRADGNLSDDETIAIVAHEMTEPLLALIDDESEPDADTIGEAIERVRTMYREKADAVAQEAVRAAQSEIAIAQNAATQALQRSTELEELIDVRVNQIAALGASVVFVATLATVVLAAILSVPGVFEFIGAGWQIAARCVTATAAALGIYLTVKGPSLGELRSGVQEFLEPRVRARMFPKMSNRPLLARGENTSEG